MILILITTCHYMDRKYGNNKDKLSELSGVSKARRVSRALIKKVPQALRIVNTWTFENWFGVNGIKKELVMFTRRHKISNFKKFKKGIVIPGRGNRKQDMFYNLENYTCTLTAQMA